MQEKQTIWQPIGAKLLVPAGKGECFCLQLKHKTFCICPQETCPVHVIGPFLDGVAHGSKVFGCVTAANALSTLRFILVQMGVEQASEYRTHDLRRGHAQDLVESGVVVFGGASCVMHFVHQVLPLPRSSRLGSGVRLHSWLTLIRIALKQTLLLPLIKMNPMTENLEATKFA